MKRTQALQIICLPVAIGAIGLVTIAVADRSSQPSQPVNASSSQHAAKSSSPVPSESPTVTVNGQPVIFDGAGQARMHVGASDTTIHKSDDTTTITTIRPGGTNTTTAGNGDVNVSIQSTSNNGGTSFSRSSVYEHSNSSGSSSSHTSVTSSGTSQ